MKTFFKIRRKSDRTFFLRLAQRFDEEGSKYSSAEFARNSWEHYGRFVPDTDVEIVEFSTVEVGATEIGK